MVSQLRSLTMQNGPLRFSGVECGSGPVVLCLHGFPDTEDSFREQMLPLASAGYRVVAMRLRGYEPASQPADRQYHVSDMAGDVLAWIDQLGVDRVHLVGHDWGATIAYAVAVSAPQRLHSLTVLAVPHPGRFEIEAARSIAQLRASWYLIFFQLRGFAEWWLKRRGIEALWRAWSPNWKTLAEALPAVKTAFTTAGVVDATLAYYRQALDRKSDAGQKSRALLSGIVKVPTLALHGQQDGCIRSEVFTRCMRSQEFPEGLQVQALADVGHFLHREQSEQVNRLLAAWFAKYCANEPQG